MEKSNGYEGVAATFINGRGRSIEGIGVSSVYKWVKTLPPNSTVLDMGCGTGLPITKVLVDAGMDVNAIDASPSLVKSFRKNFPGIPVVCEAVEDSLLFEKEFDAIIAWGLLFLLPEEIQQKIIQKAAKALKLSGKFLFTAPHEQTAWVDAMTGQSSVSLGAKKYKELLSASGLIITEEFTDEGENHYYNTVKI
ncbi:bifunctional 2-polyprenyl-6-hydroxyphenol methylase/3-demethylubiquinol 3-O-methyltransferase UbiG [Mucilaginibacter galii]|uniref:Methyltransferase n=1 Tax=Mucilaginibacter galii TaxID=2005073 RepID=A0A917JCB8_9SPHI|nr:class I SAM-dependent methyltransferase [Mucilaginibacter galii]GGI51119.1 putative methyltransferase [Mucilaginibacter galii]